jgi:hypothetical protein
MYSTADHDRHHQLFDCNYAFPFVYMVASAQYLCAESSTDCLHK